MKCRVCERGFSEDQVFEGIFEDKIDYICKNCLVKENVPLIKKPKKAEEETKKLSVSERIERLSTKHEKKEKEPYISHINLAKLKFPPKKEESSDLVDNYYWLIQHSRRKMKMTKTQVAEKLTIPLQVIDSLEKGQIPKNFHEYIDRLESFFKINLWKKKAREKYFKNEKEIVEEIKEKVEGKEERSLVKKILNLIKKENKNN
ncbi:MAG: hypothetical protein QW103_02600 [Candidatus Pacearchaeota archaeon]